MKANVSLLKDNLYPNDSDCDRVEISLISEGERDILYLKRFLKKNGNGNRYNIIGRISEKPEKVTLIL